MFTGYVVGLYEFKLVYHPFLSPLGLVFHNILQLLICLDCGIAIGTKAVVEHMHTIHKTASVHFDHSKLDSIFTTFGVQDSFSLNTLPNPCPQIEGLLVTKAYMCALCHHLRGTEESIRKHHSATHQGIPNPHVWQRVSAQQLHHRNHTPYFRIYPHSTPNTPTHLSQYVDTLHQQRVAKVNQYDIAKIDPRQVSPWLNATQWHTHIAPYDYQHLMTLVKSPNPQELHLAFLAKVVEKYTTNADNAIDTLSHLARQVLNSPINR